MKLEPTNPAPPVTLVVHREKVLIRDFRQGIESAARSSSQDNAFHAVLFPTRLRLPVRQQPGRAAFERSICLMLPLPVGQSRIFAARRQMFVG